MHQLCFLSNVEPLVLPLPPPLWPYLPLKCRLPLPFPLPSRGGGSGLGILGLGCSREEMSDLTTVSSLRHSSKVQVPLE